MDEPNRPTTRGATLRLVRAADHLDEMKQMIDRYRSNHPSPMRMFVPKSQVESGRFSPRLDWSESGKPPRRELAILVGEFSYNLRAALDYLVHQLAALNGAKYRFRYFPIETTRKKWKQRRSTWLDGLDDKHIALISGYQPFSGAHWMELLKVMSNHDKHQSLNVVVSRFGGPLTISKEKLIPVEGEQDVLEHPLPDQRVDFLLIEKLDLISTLHIILFEMAKLMDDFRPLFGDRQTFTVNDPQAILKAEDS